MNEPLQMPIREVVEPDREKIELVRSVLTRLEAGEQFSSLAILLSDTKGFEMPFNGKYWELLTAALRLIHKLNQQMDGD